MKFPSLCLIHRPCLQTGYSLNRQVATMYIQGSLTSKLLLPPILDHIYRGRNHVRLCYMQWCHVTSGWQRVVSWGVILCLQVLTKCMDAPLQMCVASKLWTDIVLRARTMHFWKKRKGLVKCVYKPCLLHCTVWANHVAVFCHLTHHITVSVVKTVCMGNSHIVPSYKNTLYFSGT